MRKEDQFGLGAGSLLTPESLANLNTLHIPVEANFHPLIVVLNSSLSADLTSRPDGFHITIIEPHESWIMKKFTIEQLEELNQLKSALRSEKAIEIAGIGLIDAHVANLREVDRAKRVAFLAVDSPIVTHFRTSIGLREKGLHVTLGFEGGDIHSQVVGTNENGKVLLAPIPKRANPALDPLREYLPTNITFGPIYGQERRKKQ